ncbi:MAG: hypothetical protein COB14_02135 [Alphaproteobacteria bacterium]|nr:MAG: hypothetical protein COB14_02135 [Alphaproteobacteria bacterium]
MNDHVKEIISKMEAAKRRLDFKPDPITTPMIAGKKGTLNIIKSDILTHYLVAEESYYTYHKDLSEAEAVNKAQAVAIAARSADTYQIRAICKGASGHVDNHYKDKFSCHECYKATFSESNIRQTYFPKIHNLRRAVNKDRSGVLHALDKQLATGGLNIKAAFDYCYAVFTELAPVSMEDYPAFDIRLVQKKNCKSCEKSVK